jgi:hypothetical protein
MLFHITIAHKCHVHGALQEDPDFADCAKALDFFKGSGKQRIIFTFCVFCIFMYNFSCAGTSFERASISIGFGTIS